MFSWRSHKENAELTERFSTTENGRLIQDLPAIHPLVKLTVNEGFLAVIIRTMVAKAVKVTRTLNMFRNPQLQRATGEERRVKIH